MTDWLVLIGLASLSVIRIYSVPSACCTVSCETVSVALIRILENLNGNGILANRGHAN